MSKRSALSFISLAFVLLFLLFFVTNVQPLSAQGITVSVSGGYTSVDMADVNNDLHDTYELLKDSEFPAQSPVNVSGGFLFTAQVMYKPNRLSYGLALHILSADGNEGYRDETGVFEEMYTTKALEIEAVGRYMLPLNRNIALFGQLGAGYGSATATHFGHFEIFNQPDYTTRVNDDLSGGYFTAHCQVGFDFRFRPVSFGVYSGYRFSNAGALNGPHVVNGEGYGNSTVKNVNGNDIKFDYSGITVGFFLTYEIAL